MKVLRYFHVVLGIFFIVTIIFGLWSNGIRWIILGLSPFLMGITLYIIPPTQNYINEIKSNRRISNKSYLTDAQIFAKRKRLGLVMTCIGIIIIVANIFLLFFYKKTEYLSILCFFILLYPISKAALHQIPYLQVSPILDQNLRPLYALYQQPQKMW